MIRIECGLILIALISAFVYPSMFQSFLIRVETRFLHFGNRHVVSVVLVGLCAIGLRIALLPLFPIPEPVVHDEFGYLLAADTFTHGRLTNPTHPMWVHFESFNILQRPTYQTYTQPAQGMVLALGKIIFGHPFWGVCLSIGLMCAAITWMLQGWFPPGWALLGGVLAVLRYAVLSNWGDSYWGGAVGALGGALVLGALPRIKTHPGVHHALLMALGLAILANNRPYEGVILSLPVAVLLFARMFGGARRSFAVTMRTVIVPMTLALLVVGFGTCYYFWRITGNPFRMPYQIERETYAVAPYLLWQHVRPEPVYRHQVIRNMYVNEELLGYHIFRSPTGILLKLYLFWSFYIGPSLSLPFLMLPFSLPRELSWHEINPVTRQLLIMSVVFTFGIALESFYTARFSAPGTCLVLALVLLAMRQLHTWNRSGLFLSRAILIICVLSFGFRASAGILHIPLTRYYEFSWYQQGSGSFGRAAIRKQLEKTPGKHLVIVHYAPNHEPFCEWVYNDADIDHSKIVWAREMDAAEDDRLIEYFKGRRVWLLNADASPPKLLPFEESAGNRVTAGSN